jgi:putative pyruvate formate lyase activating enzyme
LTPFGGPSGFTPAYLLLGLEELRRRTEKALAGLVSCRVCPRDCDVDRLSDRWAACKTGRHAVVTSAFPHLGEEDCLRGWNGSGTIFFGHCNLRCVFCQNYDISQGLEAGPPRPRPDRRASSTSGDPGSDALPGWLGSPGPPEGPGFRGSAGIVGTPGLPADALAGLMLRLQQMGCHNINFVTPEHVVPQVLEALVLAVEKGLRLPLVYNTSAYDSMESLALLDGVVDIYMPDLKLFSPELSRRYLKAGDYPEVAKAAVKEMHRQVGFLQTDGSGLATRGVLIRHLVMPRLLEESRVIFQWIAEELGPETYVNVMAQYRPGGKVARDRYPEINRPLEPLEHGAALVLAQEAGLTRLDRR